MGLDPSRESRDDAAVSESVDFPVSWMVEGPVARLTALWNSSKADSTSSVVGIPV